MRLINATRLMAAYTLGMEPSGRESLVVVIKGTFRIPQQQGATLRLHEEQLPLVMSDVFFGEPGFSAPKYEVDFAPVKRRCDIILNGSAYSPPGRPADRVEVGLRIGGWSKSFSVVGDRTWDLGATGISSSPIQPFTVMEISYGRAFGGVDTRHDDPSQHATFMRNPSGRGFHKHLKNDWVRGSPLPNTEEASNPVTRPDGNYRPMSFGSIGRQWEPRFRLAGTYSKNWLDNVFPFLPADFDDRYYQAAPEDQQLQIPVGETVVRLTNLTPDGRRTFVLPNLGAPVHVFPKSGDREDFTPFVDTIVIEPDAGRVMMTWRVSRPLQRDLFEIEQVLVGRRTRAWWRARGTGKAYYPTLAEAVRARSMDAEAVPDSVDDDE